MSLQEEAAMNEKIASAKKMIVMEEEASDLNKLVKSLQEKVGKLTDENAQQENFNESRTREMTSRIQELTESIKAESERYRDLEQQLRQSHIERDSDREALEAEKIKR